jgi:hypothetical protein
MRHVVSALILSLSAGLVASGLPSTHSSVAGTSVTAASCSAELAAHDAALRQYEADATREGMTFAMDEANRPAREALEAMKKRLAENPTAQAAKELKESWDAFQKYQKQHDVYREVLREISACLRSSNPTGCLTEPLKANLEPERLMVRVNEAFEKWVKSLGNEAISKAVERVDRARSIMQNYTQRAAGMGMEAASRGIDNCLRDFDQRVSQAQNTTAPVDVQPPPPPGAPPAPVKKGGAGKLVALGIGLGGAGLGAYYLGQQLGSLDYGLDDSDSGGGTPTITNKHEPWICSGSRCTGKLTINFPGVMNSGTITVGTSSLFLGQISVDPTKAPGSRTIDMEKSPYVTCYGTQTTVAIWNSAFTNTGPPAHSLPTSIKVECH